LNIDWLIPCRYVEVNGNLATIVGAGIDIFWVPQLPAAVAAMLAVRLTGTADEFGSEVKHQMASRVLGPSGEPIGQEIQGEFEVGGEHVRENWLNGVMLAGGFQFMAEEAGTYTVEQRFDKASASIPVHVVHGPPGTPPPDA
jgi:hypothetical protein